MTAVRAVNGCSFLRFSSSSTSSSSPSPASTPSLALLRSCINRPRPFHVKSRTSASLPRLSTVVCELRLSGAGSDVRGRSFCSLLDVVLAELASSRRRKRLPAAAVKLSGTGELVQEKLGNRAIVKGMLLEFRKDSERVLLAVAQRPDGKKNWMVYDQNGSTSSIKPQQVTYIVPGVENFKHTEVSGFAQRAQSNLDTSLLELAWVELLENNKSVTPEEFAEMIFGSMEPLESYCAHLLLSRDEIYFAILESKGSFCRYRPRPAVQVQELIRWKLAKEAAEQELLEFVQLLRSAKAMPLNAKPPKSSWIDEEKTRHRIQSLEAFAIDSYDSEDQRKTAEMVLKAMGSARTASSAVNLLIAIGYFPVHVNLDLLKFKMYTHHSEDILSEAENLLSNSDDLDEYHRQDLTHLKVYAIDVDEADELDDALSATRLLDGRIKVWIHVADPARYVHPKSRMDREALKRGTSIFLPTATYPMFPEKLAMGGMSLKQGENCNAVTVSVVLHTDGSIAEYSVDNSIIRPTYMLTYESATDLLHLNLEEEAELRLLSEAATLRLKWRQEQGAVDTSSVEARIKVTNPEEHEPSITLYVENQSHPAMRLVSEMMLLCGEVIADFGCRENIPLPYRGQPQCYGDFAEVLHLPEGPVRSAALIKMMRAAEVDFRVPLHHGILGLPGYVQFTSPIRRYMDLVAHYQVKAVIRGESPPFTPGQLEEISASVTMQYRLARKLSNSSLRYWLLEYLRGQPPDRRYRAIILRFIKDRVAAILLVEVGMQSSAWVSLGKKVGDEVHVYVEEAHPRDDILSLKESPPQVDNKATLPEDQRQAH